MNKELMPESINTAPPQEIRSVEKIEVIVKKLEDATRTASKIFGVKDATILQEDAIKDLDKAISLVKMNIEAGEIGRDNFRKFVSDIEAGFNYPNLPQEYEEKILNLVDKKNTDGFMHGEVGSQEGIGSVHEGIIKKNKLMKEKLSVEDAIKKLESGASVVAKAFEIGGSDAFQKLALEDLDEALFFVENDLVRGELTQEKLGEFISELKIGYKYVSVPDEYKKKILTVLSKKNIREVKPLERKPQESLKPIETEIKPETSKKEKINESDKADKEIKSVKSKEGDISTKENFLAGQELISNYQRLVSHLLSGLRSPENSSWRGRLDQVVSDIGSSSDRYNKSLKDLKELKVDDIISGAITEIEKNRELQGLLEFVSGYVWIKNNPKSVSLWDKLKNIKKFNKKEISDKFEKLNQYSKKINNKLVEISKIDIGKPVKEIEVPEDKEIFVPEIKKMEDPKDSQSSVEQDDISAPEEIIIDKNKAIIETETPDSFSKDNESIEMEVGRIYEDIEQTISDVWPKEMVEIVLPYIKKGISEKDFFNPVTVPGEVNKKLLGPIEVLIKLSNKAGNKEIKSRLWQRIDDLNNVFASEIKKELLASSENDKSLERLNFLLSSLESRLSSLDKSGNPKLPQEYINKFYPYIEEIEKLAEDNEGVSEEVIEKISEIKVLMSHDDNKESENLGNNTEGKPLIRRGGLEDEIFKGENLNEDKSVGSKSTKDSTEIKDKDKDTGYDKEEEFQEDSKVDRAKRWASIMKEADLLKNKGTIPLFEKIEKNDYESPVEVELDGKNKEFKNISDFLKHLKGLSKDSEYQNNIANIEKKLADASLEKGFDTSNLAKLSDKETGLESEEGVAEIKVVPSDFDSEKELEFILNMHNEDSSNQVKEDIKIEKEKKEIPIESAGKLTGYFLEVKTALDKIRLKEKTPEEILNIKTRISNIEIIVREVEVILKNIQGKDRNNFKKLVDFFIESVVQKKEDLDAELKKNKQLEEPSVGILSKMSELERRLANVKNELNMNVVDIESQKNKEEIINILNELTKAAKLGNFRVIKNKTDEIDKKMRTMEFDENFLFYISILMSSAIKELEKKQSDNQDFLNSKIWLDKVFRNIDDKYRKAEIPVETQKNEKNNIFGGLVLFTQRLEKEEAFSREDLEELRKIFSKAYYYKIKDELDKGEESIYKKFIEKVDTLEDAVTKDFIKRLTKD